jgi:cytidylate kinase
MTGRNPQIIIAIDGPAASGKSTTARSVAKKLGYRYIDTGAMYRAITVKVLDTGIDPRDTNAITDLIKHTTVAQEESGNGPRFLLDSVDVTDRLRTPKVDRAIGPVCEVPALRRKMVTLQRQLGKNGGVVLEGRDIGTVVFPHAELKVFLIADVSERAHRRVKDLRKQGLPQDIETAVHEITARDRRDTGRHLSPLSKAEDARELDTTNLTIEEQVDIIVGWAKAIIDRKHEEP